MASRILTIFALVALVAVLVEGKLTCNGKSPNYAGLAMKFAKCAGWATPDSKHGLATRCIIEVIKNPPTAKAAEDYFKGAVPAAAKGFVETEMKKCEVHFPKCKSHKDDSTGNSCMPLKNCVMGFISKVCTK